MGKPDYRAMADVYRKAHAAGMAAGNAAKPVPMVVREAEPISGKPLSGGKSWYVPEGVCGFAWVRVRPGNSPFANWLKNHGHGRKAYEGGVDVWVGEFNQSMERKEAYAHAFAKVVEEAGVCKSVYAMSRMD